MLALAPTTPPIVPLHPAEAPIRILAVPGSLRAGSFNRQLLEAFAQLAPAGVQVDLYDGLAQVEPFNEDIEASHPPHATAFTQAVRGADAVAIATPDYNRRIPGVLKNALDWASRYDANDANAFTGKPSAVLSASPGFKGGSAANADLHGLLGELDAAVAPATIAVGRVNDAFTAAGALADPAQAAQLQAVMDALVATVRAARATQSAPAAA